VKRALIALLLLAACDYGSAAGGKTKVSPKDPVGPKPQPTQDSGAKPPEPEPVAPAITKLPGFDLSALPAPRRQAFLEAVGQEVSPCDRPETVASCVVNNPQCADCSYLARAAYRLARDGVEEVDASRLGQFMTSLREAMVAPVRSFDITGSPTRGAGPITVVEFADFQCPHCAELHEQLELLLPQIEPKVKFTFKNFPLPKHLFAEPAARASLAANKQGKFWEYQDLLFTRQEKISQENLFAWAEELKLDMTKFKADFESKELIDQVARDRKEAEAAEIPGTPALFIEGRLYGDQLTPEAIRDAIDFAAMKKGAPAPR
jgi:protein-disulfide isomerase